MMSGYLLQDTTTAAFSRETRSAGRPSVFQTAWSASLARTLSGSMPVVHGIYLSAISGSQASRQSCPLKEAENGPM